MSSSKRSPWNSKVVTKIRKELRLHKLGSELVASAYAAKLTTGRRQTLMAKEIACLFRQIPEIERRDKKWILIKYPSKVDG